MSQLNLHRTESGAGGTFGTLYNAFGRQLAVTVERPPSIDHPCIEVGEYPWVKFISPHNGACLLLTVPGRSMIEMHSANVMVELLGCIAPGATFAQFKGEHDGEPYDLKGVTNSKATLAMILGTLPDHGTITITEDF